MIKLREPVKIGIGEKQIKIEFGKGDIRIVSSGELDGSVGYLALENQVSKPIGKNKEPEDNFSPDKYPILMSFTKVESIDALIGELQRVRDIMDSRLVYEVEYEIFAISGRTGEKVLLNNPKESKRIFYSAIAMNQWLEEIEDSDIYKVVSVNTSRREI